MAEESPITAQGPSGALHGTLIEAEAPRAVALILPGSGPTDRDGNNPFGLNTDAYRLLAEGLAAQGITTARIDKRGIGESEGDPNAVSFAEYREDTAAWIAALDADCVWLIGHSEGSLLAVGGHDLPGVCGLVLLTPPGRPLGALLRDQVANGPFGALVMPAFDAALAAMIAGEEPDLSTLPPPLAALFAPATRAYLTELVSHDPAQALAEVDIPTLLVHGGADVQVPPSEANPLTNARPDIPAHLIPTMTHTLKEAPIGADPGVTYTDPTLPLHSQLVPLIAGFILEPR